MTQKRQRTQFDIMNPLRKAVKDAGLSPIERLMLYSLYFFMDGDGVCFPSYGAIIEETGLSRQSVSNTIKKLVERGMISYEKGDTSKSNRYRLNLFKLGLIDVEKKEKERTLDLGVGFVSPSSCKYFPRHKFSCKAEYIAMRMKEEKKERESA